MNKKSNNNNLTKDYEWERYLELKKLLENQSKTKKNKKFFRELKDLHYKFYGLEEGLIKIDEENISGPGHN